MMLLAMATGHPSVDAANPWLPSGERLVGLASGRTNVVPRPTAMRRRAIPGLPDARKRISTRRESGPRPGSIPAFQRFFGGETNAHFGHSVAGVGDLNGDGFDDVAVGAPDERHLGTVTVFYGSPAGLNSKTTWRYDGPGHDGQNGFSISGAGDVNGDRLPDLLVGAPWTKHAGMDGTAFVFHGRREGLAATPDWSAVGQTEGAMFGFAVAPAGDVNGDTIDDILIGDPHGLNPGAAGSKPGHGSAYVYLGSPNGLGRSPAWVHRGRQYGSSFAHAVAGVGDVNADGYDDILVGDHTYSSGHNLNGRVWLFLGSPMGPDPEPSWQVTGVQPDQNLGAALGAAGDLNNDGYADILIAANRTDHDQDDEGIVVAFFGGPDGPGCDPDWVVESNQSAFLWGHSVAGTGDVNGDGHNDIIIGACYGDRSFPDQGVAAVFLGVRGGLSRVPAWSVEGAGREFQLGSSVRAAGDVNGDGYADVIVGSAYHRENIPEEGMALVAYGSVTGLRGGSGWRPPGEVLGFEFKRITFPVPNSFWRWLAAAGLGFGVFWFTRRYYRKQGEIGARIAAERLSARVEERMRIARDLHDRLGAHAAEIRLLATSGGGTSNESTADTLRRSFQRVGAAAAEFSNVLNELVWLTKPQNDTLRALLDRLSDYAASVLSGAEIECNLEMPASVPAITVSTSVRQHTVAMLKEVLTNTIRHARARRVRIRISTAGDLLTLEIRDDGRGFDASAKGMNAGDGLTNLQTRASELDGECEIHSAPGVGTTVHIRIGLRGSPREKQGYD